MQIQTHVRRQNRACKLRMRACACKWNTPIQAAAPSTRDTLARSISRVARWCCRRLLLLCTNEYTSLDLVGVGREERIGLGWILEDSREFSRFSKIREISLHPAKHLQLAKLSVDKVEDDQQNETYARGDEIEEGHEAGLATEPGRARQHQPLAALEAGHGVV